MITTTLPIFTVSEANRREHHMVRHRRRKKQRADAHMLMKQFKRPRLPVTITLTRVAPRILDSHDNLPMSLKSAVDGICDWLGVDDQSEEVRILYGQIKRPATHEIHVRIEEFRPTELRGYECQMIDFKRIPCAIT